MLDGKDSSVEQMENVKIYVNAEHGRRIKRLESCDSSEKIEKIRNFGAQRKTRVSVPPNRVSEYRNAGYRHPPSWTKGQGALNQTARTLTAHLDLKVRATDSSNRVRLGWCPRV